MEDAQDEIYRLISLIEGAKTVAERRDIAKQLRVQFTYYCGEVRSVVAMNIQCAEEAEQQREGIDCDDEMFYQFLTRREQ